MKKRKTCFFLISFLMHATAPCYANTTHELNLLKKAYPDFIKSVKGNSFTWHDGTVFNVNDAAFAPTKDSPSLSDQLNQPHYPSTCGNIPTTDPGRVRNQAFFEKMYGNSKMAVERNLVTIYWMPLYFGHHYRLRVTRINGVNQKLQTVSHQLELLVKKHPSTIQYLKNPAGTFYWRDIKNSHRLSAHSYGIAIDINSQKSNYWMWDTHIKEDELKQDDHFPYKNSIPCDIVRIFEKNGFIWGGKWQHYDTMHFEYRPELIH